mgnify:CR=1 FL=1
MGKGFAPAIAGRADVAERMLLALQFLEQANHALAEHYSIAEPLTADLVYQHPTEQADVLKNALGLFTKSYNEVLRAHGNAPGETRPLFWYYAKRGEFSLHYTNALIALAAADARSSSSTPTGWAGSCSDSTSCGPGTGKAATGTPERRGRRPVARRSLSVALNHPTAILAHGHDGPQRPTAPGAGCEGEGGRPPPHIRSWSG